MDFGSAFAQKYSIMQQQANSQQTLDRASANLSDQNAKEVGANAAAARGVQNAQAGRIGMETSLLPGQTAADIAAKNAATGQSQMQTHLAPGLAQSTIGLQGTQQADNLARAGLANSQSSLTNVQAETGRLGNRSALPMVNAAGDMWQLGRQTPPLIPDWAKGTNVDPSHRYAYASGTTRVPGHGDGTVDTVPAMLAPGEAVLNKGAAEHVGRGLIDHLNAVGAAKMGMAEPVQKFAKGTSKVGKAPTITPQMLQMLLQPPGGAPQGGAPQGGAPQQGGGLMAALQQGMV